MTHTQRERERERERKGEGERDKKKKERKKERKRQSEKKEERKKERRKTLLDSLKRLNPFLYLIFLSVLFSSLICLSSLHEQKPTNCSDDAKQSR